MIYFTDLKNLMEQWEQRASDSTDSSYAIALKECVYDLKNLIDTTLDQQNKDWEAAKEEYLKKFEDEVCKTLLEEEADDYLASMEAHEHIA